LCGVSPIDWVSRSIRQLFVRALSLPVPWTELGETRQIDSHKQQRRKLQRSSKTDHRNASSFHRFSAKRQRHKLQRSSKVDRRSPPSFPWFRAKLHRRKLQRPAKTDRRNASSFHRFCHRFWGKGSAVRLRRLLRGGGEEGRVKADAGTSRTRYGLCHAFIRWTVIAPDGEALPKAVAIEADVAPGESNALLNALLYRVCGSGTL
jgi:hypothetical protein